MKPFVVKSISSALLSVLLLTTSCMVGPDYEQPHFFDNTQIEKSLDLKPATKQKEVFTPLDFNDQTLDTLIGQSLSASPTIRTALVRLRQGRETLKIQEVSLLPTLDANAKYNYAKESKNMGYLLQEDYYQATLDMSWELDIFGGTRRRTQAAEANLRGAIENLKNVHVSLVSDVSMAYINLRTAEQLLKNAKSNLKLQENIYATIREKYAAGLTDEIALDQAKYLVETTRMSIPQLEYQQISAQNALSLLVGQLPGTLNEMLAQEKKNLVEKPFKYDVTSLYELPADTIRLRPDVRVAEEQLIAQNAQVGVAIADMFPKITLSGMLGFQSLTFPKLMNHKSYEYGYVPEVSMPIFHWGALKNNVELQKSIKEEYMIAYEQALLTAASEINKAMVAIEKEIQRNKSAKMAYDKMNSVSKLNWDKYQRGLIEYSDVLDAEQRRLSAQTQMVNSNCALYQNIVTFYKAIGGIFPREELNQKISDTKNASNNTLLKK